ncbi:hypothetical protein HaLaN_10826 [Haematococcus lacustris]|uniref:Uncharacterized protein n=1 Tax=Haematococcus lacustris TaxID=44745 RepID=A0A699Z5Z5_HAELA|nr:hypothetical protein HaLaN_10826 [Haematococcus lacustris]
MTGSLGPGPAVDRDQVAQRRDLVGVASAHPARANVRSSYRVPSKGVDALFRQDHAAGPHWGYIKQGVEPRRVEREG